MQYDSANAMYFSACYSNLPELIQSRRLNFTSVHKSGKLIAEWKGKIFTFFGAENNNTHNHTIFCAMCNKETAINIPSRYRTWCQCVPYKDQFTEMTRTFLWHLFCPHTKLWDNLLTLNLNKLHISSCTFCFFLYFLKFLYKF